MAALKISALLALYSLVIAEVVLASSHCVFHTTHGELRRGKESQMFRVLTVEECHQIFANTNGINFGNFIVTNKRYRNKCMLMKDRPTQIVNKTMAQYFTGRWILLVVVIVVVIVVVVVVVVKVVVVGRGERRWEVVIALIVTLIIIVIIIFLLKDSEI